MSEIVYIVNIVSPIGLLIRLIALDCDIVEGSSFEYILHQRGAFIQNFARKELFS